LNLLATVQLGRKPSVTGESGVELVTGDFQISFWLGIIQFYDYLASRYMVAFVDEYLFDDPTFQVLDRFFVALRGNKPRRDDGASQRRYRRPTN